MFQDGEIYICQFCTYGFIYGEDPIHLIRQYNRKRNAEIQLRRERRKMLEKARMKGKKGTGTTGGSGGAGGGSGGGTGGVVEEVEDDGLCCTCGQKVGQHNHLTSTTSTAGTTQQGIQSQGQGPGKVK